mmetsp:Transcript_18135/g.30444  ORF Transcript_18135/g.30444 Transcript_18135/m.30444 type:complete len:225 (+) Transcript_18135:1020-1694(+)
MLEWASIWSAETEDKDTVAEGDGVRGNADVDAEADAIRARLVIASMEIDARIAGDLSERKIYYEGMQHNSWVCEFHSCTTNFYFGGAHHCRICGLTVCEDHSMTNLSIPVSDLTKEMENGMIHSNNPIVAYCGSEAPNSLLLKRVCSKCAHTLLPEGSCPLPPPSRIASIQSINRYTSSRSINFDSQLSRQCSVKEQVTRIKDYHNDFYKKVSSSRTLSTLTSF